MDSKKRAAEYYLMSNRWLIARVRLLSNLGTFFRLFLERWKPCKTRKTEKKNTTSDLMSRTLHRPSIRVQMHTCAPSIFENRAPRSCYHSTADVWLLIFMVFHHIYRVCHNFVLLGKVFTSTSRLYKIATYQPLWCFMRADSLESLDRTFQGLAGNFGMRRILSRYSKRAKGFGGLGLLAFGSHNSSSACNSSGWVMFDSDDFHWPFLSCT